METNLDHKPITFFHDAYVNGRLDLKPKYQRNPVWSKSMQAYLIDTIMRELPIPKIYVETEVNITKGVTSYKVVDGQQRLRAILSFISDELTISKDYNPELAGKSFKELDPDIQKKFWKYRIATEELGDATPSEIKDMFVRLNKNTVKLNKQELRHAQYEGDFITLAEELADDYWETKKIISRQGIRRMSDVEFVSELLMVSMYEIQDKKKKLDKCYADNELMPNKLKIRRKFEKIVSITDELLPDLETTRFKNKGDFYSLFYTIYNLLENGYKFGKEDEAIRKNLIELSQSAHKDTENTIALRYYTVTVDSPDAKSSREFRFKILKDLIEPLLIKTDERRNFNETQKQFIWHRSKNKKCAICGKVVKNYADYEPDHIKPWSKGGLTDVMNGQVTHRTCNRRKYNKECLAS